MTHDKLIASALLAMPVLLAGCAVGPDYVRPTVDVPAAFKEASNWTTAEPAEQAPVGHWWKIYGDPDLDQLMAQVEVSNQNVHAAEAQYRKAAALLDSARAAWFPTVTGDLSSTRSRSAAGTGFQPGVAKADRVSLSAGWEADVWGRIRRSVESGEATAQASAADLRAALLSAQATLAQSYMQLRVTDAQRKMLDDTTIAYERSLQITRNRYEAGVAARLDVAQAEAQLRQTQAQAVDLGVQRAQLEHAIAILIGKAPAEFTLPPRPTLPDLPDVPGALPSALLERRPDIAGAERRVAAANAGIGVAQAAFFPALTLSGTGGYQSSGFANLISAPNRFWSVGPALALTLFDGGARSAAKAQAVAGYDASVASYRQTVLSAFQEVEDNLASLRILAEEALYQRDAARAAAESLTLADNQYRAGTVSYLNVVSAQATSLSADRAAIDIAGRRLVASVGLLKALGGDWRTVSP